MNEQGWGSPDGLRDEGEAPTVRLRRMRGLVLVWGWLLVHRERVVAGARRHGPRTVRAVHRVARWSRHQAGGVFAAVCLSAGPGLLPVLRLGLASPRWSQLAAGAAAWVRGRRVTLAGLALLGLGWLLGPGWVLGWLLFTPGAAWALTRVGMAFYPHTTRGRVRTRYGADGWLSYWEWHRSLSAHAVRWSALRTRPSIAAGLPPVVETAAQVRAVGPGVAAADYARRASIIEHLPVTECGTWVGATAVGPMIGLNCYVALNESVGVVAPPQSGKSQAIVIGTVIDHHGAVVSTSTKPDIYLATAALRALMATGPSAANLAGVLVFNPQDLGGIGSNLRFSPTRGCANVRVARRNAGLLVGGVPAKGDDSGDRWDEWAGGVLACLLMAADRKGLDMATVARWVFSQAEGAKQALGYLREVGDDARTAVPPLVIDALSQVTTTDAKKTRDAIFLTLTNAVRFMENPTIAAVCCPAPDEPALDVAALIRDRATLYILGDGDTKSGLAPLLACLTGVIFDEAKAISTRYPGEFLDPTLLLALDEAALITPVPLDEWLADAGGRGITIVWAVQSPSQLGARWGERGADTIWNATNALLVFGGLTVPEDLDMVSKLTDTRLELVPDPDGTRLRPRRGTDGRGHARLERLPVCPAGRVRTIPRWHALLIYRDQPATVVRLTPGYRRSDVRRAGRPGPLTTPRCPTTTTAGAGPAAGSTADRQPALAATAADAAQTGQRGSAA